MHHRLCSGTFENDTYIDALISTNIKAKFVDDDIRFRFRSFEAQALQDKQIY